MFWFPLALALALEISSNSIKILQMTDLHYGEGDLPDRLNVELQEKLLKWETPDLVVITGDIVSGYAWPWTSNWYQNSYDKFIKPFTASNTPWALVLGNHDIEADLSGAEILEIDQDQSLSQSKTLPLGISHSSNYFVPITHQGKLKLIVWCLDTGNRNHLEFGYDRVHEDQIQWITNTQKVLNEEAGYSIPGIIFLHIPPPEFMDVWENSIGHKYEEVACPGNHTRYFLSSLSNIIAVAAGHDHFNDYEGKIGDILLYYGRKTGYSGVGPEPYFEKGARVFLFEFSEGKLSSWIRDETGTRVEHKGREGMLGHQRVCAESIPNSSNVFMLPVLFVGIIAAGWCLRKTKSKPERFMI